MAKKQIGFKTKGMNQDLSVSAFNPEFSFENINLRLSTNESNTLLSWVNERGPKKVTLNIDTAPWKKEEKTYTNTLKGTPIGTAIIDHKLVLFTTAEDGDRIYKLTYEAAGDEIKMEGAQLYMGDLNFSTSNPIESLVSYETVDIEKVYWVDGRNQPRVINIEESAEGMAKWQGSTTCFDFVPSLSFGEEVTIKQGVGYGGTFAPGTIQYCMTYVDYMGQQSNIFYLSPLYYLTNEDRAASPEEKVNSNFNIVLKNANSSFKYVRIYSIQRTSLDAEPYAKVLSDLDIIVDGNTVNDIIYNDNGTTGESADPTELLYVGGKEIICKTIVDKDNTLFLGNIKETAPNVDPIQDYFDEIRLSESEEEKISIEFHPDKTLTLDPVNNFYGHTQTIKKNHREISTFKGGEEYRFGFQLQTKTGNWTDPIFIDDVKNTFYPNTSVFNYEEAQLITASCILNKDNSFREDIKNKFREFKRIRPVVVYPEGRERNVICQGVINPTLFNVQDRPQNAPFAQPDWFFRPYVSNLKVVNPDEAKDCSEYEEQEEPGITDYDHDFGEYPYYDYYSLIIQAEEETIKTIRNRGFIGVTKTTYKNNQVEKTENISISDFIIVPYKSTEESSTETTSTYLLLKRSSMWPEYSVRVSEEEIIECEYEEGVDAVSISTEPYKLTSNVIAEGQMYYYLKKVDNPSTSLTYINIKVCDWNDYQTGEKYYTAYFERRKSDKESEDTENHDDEGSYLHFTHYDDLFNTTDLGAKENPGLLAKPIEIQGSKEIYSSPFKDKIDSNDNTQFFIDQSILTLHSPDLEFAEDLQAINIENAQLCIIGAVPITACKSAHSVTTSTPSVPTMYMWNASGDNNMMGAYSHIGPSRGRGNLDEKNVSITNSSTEAGKRLVSDYYWEDVVRFITYNDGYWDEFRGQYTSKACLQKYMVYPWQASGSLTNDDRAGDGAWSLLKQKRLGNLLYSTMPEYFKTHSTEEENEIPNPEEVTIGSVSVQTYIYDSGRENIRFGKQWDGANADINYRPIVDKVLSPTEFVVGMEDTDRNDWEATTKVTWKWDYWWHPYGKRHDLDPDGQTYNPRYNPIQMKYKTTTHAVLVLNGNKDAETTEGKYIPIAPYAQVGVNLGAEYIGKYTNDRTGKTFWDDNMMFKQDGINITKLFRDGNNTHQPFDFLWLAELRQTVENKFGGKSRNALKANKWIIAGESTDILDSDGTLKKNIVLKWEDGDTFFQRYDCLKCYESTSEDINIVKDVLSFMCETRENCDGRYDKNRTYTDSNILNLTPLIHNKANPVYDQKDNFFTQRKVMREHNKDAVYPNLLYYTKTKTLGADVDAYTNITLASTLDLDGDKGAITALRRFNNQLIAFQDSGISQILYNENVQVSTQSGVPIEIANSQKVQGKRYLSDDIGCSNKWSIVESPSGLYFMDSNNKSIYLFNGQLNNLSGTLGFNTWAKNNIPKSDVDWDPKNFNNYVGYYDRLNQDVLFINKDRALAYNERLNAFTSFYDYGYTPWFCNLDDVGLWIRKDASIWQHQAGEYCDFFSTKVYDGHKPYSMTLVGNPEPQLDKIFTNLEFRASVEGDGEPNQNADKFAFYLPFDSLETWNDYQKGSTQLQQRWGHSAAIHFGNDGISSLKRKFRIWRCDIPRDNNRRMDRMRNPWLYLKLWKEKDTNRKVEIHDIVMTYFD